jgi:hypothetical protein
MVALKYIVAETEDVDGFTEWTHGVDTVVVRGPDRCEIDSPGGYRLGDIGDYEYTNSNGGRTWQRSELFATWDNQRDFGTSWLTPLLYTNQVSRSGNVYEVGIEPTVLNSVQISGTWSVKLFVCDDRIVKETVTNHTPEPQFALHLHPGPLLVTYGSFGSSSPVTVPPFTDLAG